MAMAADLVIAQVEEVVRVGELDPDEIMTPGTCVDMVVKL
jgi:acyl CoA:acetate/3-ketoacid CoA transferase alpha subunit